MKILHICMTQYSNGWSYQENMLAKYHKLAGNDVYVLTSMFCYEDGKLVEDTVNDFIDENGVRVLRLKKKKEGLFGKLPVYNNFEKTIDKISPDIIFSHGCQYRDIKYVKKYVQKNNNCKLFIDNHADFTNSATNFISKNFLHKIIWKYYAHMILPYTEKFWGVLPARVDFLLDVYKLPKEKCDLLVMGADDELVQKSNSEIANNRLREKYKIKDTDFLIVTGGKIDKAKLQTELLMKAVANIKNSDVKLLIFGSIEEDIKERILSLVDGDKVIYVGWIDSKKSYDYFAIADLVVFPGRHSVFWEQVAGQGKPMICRSWPGTHHIDVGGNVLFLEYDSVELIITSIEKLMFKNKSYIEMNKSAKYKAKDRFSYKEIAKSSISFNY